MAIFTDPVAQAWLIGSLIAAAIGGLGMVLGFAIADDRRQRRGPPPFC